ncbi:MAG: hypothetical protein ABI400_01235 [Lacisediminihabitans sp.]
MSDDQKVAPLETVRRLEDAARDLARSTHEIPRPSDVHEVLSGLKSAQGMLTQTYEQLAAWHAEVVEGVHHAGADDAEDSGSSVWVRAEYALHEAAHYSANAVDALERARSANAIAHWFDEIRVDEG